MQQQQNFQNQQRSNADNNILRLAEALGLEYWAAAEPQTKVAVVRVESDIGGHWQPVSISHDKIVRGTYDNWQQMLKNSALTFEKAMSQRDKHGGGGVVAFWALVPADVICLDFDGVNEGGLSEDWWRWLQGAAIERSASGRGLHAFFRVPEAFATKIRGDRETHTGFPFRWKGAASGAGCKGVDVFFGGANRVIKVTGDAVNDWQQVGDFRLCEEGLAVLEREFEEQGWFIRSTAAAVGRVTEAKVNLAPDIGGLGSEVTRLETEAVGRLGAGIESSAEVLRLMRQHSYGHGVQGFWCRVLDGDAETIETHYRGWSEGDLAALREMTFYSRRAEVLLDAMADCKLTLRGEGYTGSNRNKWDRLDYVEATLKAAYKARLESGQTYQARQVAKAQMEHQQQATRDALPELLQERLELGKGGSIRATLNNAVAFLELHPAFEGLLGWNDIANRAEIIQMPVWSTGRAVRAGAISKDALGAILAKLHQTGCKVRRSDLEAAIPAVAERRAFNPIADRLRALVWDGMPRLKNAGSTYFNLDTSYSEAAVSLVNKLICKTFVGIAKRGTMQHGETIKHDTLLILMGPPGTRKSTAVRVIGETFGTQFFTDSLPALREDPKELQRAIRGLLVAEAGELASLLHDRTGIQTLKNVITISTDRIRENYNEHSTDMARLCVMIGTFNPQGIGFIDDFAMVRRLWPVKVGGVIDTAGLLRDREQLFAEALHLAQQGYTNFLDQAEDIKLQEDLMREFYKENCLLDAIETKLEEWERQNQRIPSQDRYFRLGELFSKFGDSPNGLCLLAGKTSFQAVQGLMAEALRQLGYGTKPVRSGSGNAKRNHTVWYKLEAGTGEDNQAATEYTKLKNGTREKTHGLERLIET